MLMRPIDRLFFRRVTMATLVMIASSASAVGPSTEATMSYITDRYSNYGGGIGMQKQRDGSYRYHRLFPKGINLEGGKTLVVESTQAALLRPERIAPEQIRGELMELRPEPSAPIERFEAPLQQLDPGRVRVRRGDWGAARSTITTSGMISLVCKSYQRCVRDSEGRYHKSIDIYVEEPELRQKMAKALQHLVTQHQRNGDLF